MRKLYRLLIIVIIVLSVLCVGAWWSAFWFRLDVLNTSGGLWWPVQQVIPVPHFAQDDERWRMHCLGSTKATLGAEGCAVTSAAMVLATYGMKVTPASLNEFLTSNPNGYTEEGWIYWETAPLLDSQGAQALLPHYEGLPSYALIDKNLFFGNPVIIRLRLPSGITHFVVIVGKNGFDYLIADPAQKSGVYPLRQLGSKIEALRFYRASAL